MIVQPICRVTAPDVSWLWSGYLADGSLAILDSDPGVGKSLNHPRPSPPVSAPAALGPTAPQAPAPPHPSSSVPRIKRRVIRQRLTVAGPDPGRKVFLCTQHRQRRPPHTPVTTRRYRARRHARPGGAPRRHRPDHGLPRSHGRRQRRRPCRRGPSPRSSPSPSRAPLHDLDGPAPPTSTKATIHSIAAAASDRLRRRLPSLAGWPSVAIRRRRADSVGAQTKNNYHPPNASLSYALPTDGPRIAWLGTSGLSAAELAHPLAGGPERQRDTISCATSSPTARASRAKVWAAALEQTARSKQSGVPAPTSTSASNASNRTAAVSPTGRCPRRNASRIYCLAPLHIPIAATPLDDDLPVTDLDTLLAMGKRDE